MSQIENARFLGKITKVMSGTKRVAAFSKIAEGKDLTEVADEIGISRSGLQNYVDDFREHGLIVKQTDSYKLTATGERVLEWLKEMDEEMAAIQREQEELSKEVKEELEERGIGFKSPKGREILEGLLEEAEKEQERE